uniref:Linker for activation of T-cells family member 2 n=1 Tax=Globodera pallida TaxID=36090 RepID=A0A183CFZ0_GLOPA
MIALTLIPLHLLTFIVVAVFIVLAQCCACCKRKKKEHRPDKFASSNDSNYSTLGQLDTQIFVKPRDSKWTPAASGYSARNKRADRNATARILKAPKFASSHDQDYMTLAQLDTSIFVKKLPPKSRAPPARSSVSDFSNFDSALVSR